MKLKLFFFPLILLSFLISACLIKSFNPFFLKKDVVFLESIIGDYLDEDSLRWEFNKPENKNFLNSSNKPARYYNVKYVNDEGKNSYFIVNLFTINGDHYMDFFPDFETLENLQLFSLHVLPVHSLAKVEMNGPGLLDIKWYNEDWLRTLYKEEKINLDYQELYTEGDGDGEIVLSASSEKLREFIMKFGNDPDAFDCDNDQSNSICTSLKKI